MTMALVLVKNCTKLALAGGAVYWSVQQGIWGCPEEGSEAMKRLSSAIVPPPEPIKEVIVKTEPAISKIWNKGTKVVFDTLLEAPHTVGSCARYASNTVTKFVVENVTNK